MDKKLWWVHDASNCEYTYLDISPKRGNAGMEQCGVLPEFKGIDENHPEQKWASAFIDLLLEMKKVKDKAVEKGKDFLSYYHYHKFDKKYDELIEQAQNRECSMAVVANKTFPILCFCLGYYGDFSSPLHPLVRAIVTWRL